MLSFEKNLTSGSSSAAYRWIRGQGGCMCMRRRARCTALQAGCRRGAGGVSSRLLAQLGEQLLAPIVAHALPYVLAALDRVDAQVGHLVVAHLEDVRAELGLQLVLVEERGEDGGALEQHGTELEALLRLALLEHG